MLHGNPVRKGPQNRWIATNHARNHGGGRGARAVPCRGAGDGVGSASDEAGRRISGRAAGGRSLLRHARVNWQVHLLLPLIYLLIFKCVPMWDVGQQIEFRGVFAVGAILMTELNRPMAVASE